MQVNSKEWWEDFFLHHWEVGLDGKQQTAHFMEVLLDNLSDDLVQFLGQPGVSILDWGCALGQGVDVLTKRFPLTLVTGYDIAANAIWKAGTLFPHLQFRNAPPAAGESFDVVISSNVLEHFHKPLEEMTYQIRHASRYYVALVPYNQQGIQGTCHFMSFTLDSFPLWVNEFQRVFTKIIPPTKMKLWNEYQLLVIYSRKG